MTDLARDFYPKVVERYEEALSETGGKSMFGIWDLLCINIPSGGDEAVSTKFHLDWKNLAYGLCMIAAIGE